MMGVSRRQQVSFVLVLLTLFAVALSHGAPRIINAVSPPNSTVYINPQETCCGTPNAPYVVNQSFTVSVSVNLASGEAINGFDVRVNYTNPHTAAFKGVLQAVSVSDTSNIFSSYQSTQVPIECIDDILIQGTDCQDDSLGQVHFGEVLAGSEVIGPFQGTLFVMTFKVTGFGNSTFVVDRANLVNPSPNPNNPQLLNPQYIPVLKYAGIFGNQGVTPFFNFQPADTSVSPSVLPNQAVTFDASGSFDPRNSSMTFRSYSWSFGDKTPRENFTIATVNHSFPTSGNYTVSLTVIDEKNQTGTLPRRIDVLSALGSIALIVEDQQGTVQRGNVVVNVFNSSSSNVPFASQTINELGDTQFNNLVPGNYYLTFAGQTITGTSKTETVLPGWTTQDTVYLSIISGSADNSGIIYLGTVLGGLAVVAAVIIYQRRKGKPAAKKRTAKEKAR